MSIKPGDYPFLDVENVAMARMKERISMRQVAVQECVLVVALTWVGFFTWNGPFQKILMSWIGQAPAATLVHYLSLLSEVAWW